MSKKINKRGAVVPRMNITPLIDVVFLLIIFFMVVSRMVAEEREPMIVPSLDNPRAEKLATDGRIVVNVALQTPSIDNRISNMSEANAHLAIDGTARYVKLGFKRYAMSELARVTRRLRQAKQRNKEVEVLLRADAALYYSEVAPVMAAITHANIEKVNMVTYTEEVPF